MIVEITDLSRGGAGVAKTPEGQVVFVPLTLPGDRVRIRVVRQEKNYCDAEVEEWIAYAPQRISPRCSVFGECGGCSWQHVPYELQWATKRSGVRHALKRVQVDPPEAWEEFPATEIWGYRNRIQLRGSGEAIGFFARRSRRLVPIERCEVARPELNARLPHVRQEGSRLANDYKVELDVLPDGTTREAWNQRHAALGFRQVNDLQNERMRTWINAQISSGRVLYDLYGGSGNLSWALAERMVRVHCVDVSAPSERQPAQPANFAFHRESVTVWIRKRAAEANIASAIIDPPRDGLRENFKPIAEAVKKLNVREIVAVGCDPDAWARDVRHWLDRGFRFEAAALFDFFPHTPHIESVAVLRF